MLELEIKESVPATDQLAQSWLGRGGEEGVVEGLLFATSAEGDPAELVAAFDRLAAWVDNSLDLYKVSEWSGAGEGLLSIACAYMHAFSSSRAF